MVTRPEARRNGGFTLIEVLVALAILAVTAAFAFRAFSGALDTLTGSGRERAALIVAQSILDRVGRDIALRDGDAAGQTADGFTWRLRMMPDGNATSCTLEPCDMVLRGITVAVDVDWTEQRRPRRVRLATLRLAEEAGD